MKRLLALIVCAVLLCGAASAEAPVRVAVLFSSFAEMWQEAGGSIAVTVGESVERGFADEGVILVDAGAGKTVNMELLIASAPDLVILSLDIAAQAQAIEVLEAAGIPCLGLRVDSFAGYAAAFKQMTDITGNTEVCDIYVTAQEQEIAKLQAENRFDGKTYAFIRAGSSAASTKLKKSEEHFACELINGFGLVNICDGALAASGAVNTEALLSVNPDYIFISLMGDEDAALASVKQLLAGPEWQYLDAVSDGRVIVLPKELFHFKPCSRWAKACGYLAGLLSV